jgi:hypothetical protein
LATPGVAVDWKIAVAGWVGKESAAAMPATECAFCVTPVLFDIPQGLRPEIALPQGLGRIGYFSFEFIAIPKK